VFHVRYKLDSYMLIGKMSCLKGFGRVDLKETCVGQSGLYGFYFRWCDHANFRQCEQLRVVQETQDIDCI
jgi:hypothetical protein